MPVAPERLRRAHEVWKAEVLDELDAHQLRRAARDVRVAGEVAVDLEREGVDAEQDVDARVWRRRIEGGVGEPGEVVGDEDFLEVPHAMSHAPSRICSRVMRRGASICDSRFEARRIGPGHQVRKERDEHREVQQVARRRDLAPVDVDDVAHRHERVERDADRQQDSQGDEVDVPPERAEESVQAVGEEIEVLEESEQREVEPQADDEQRAARSRGGRSRPALARS